MKVLKQRPYCEFELAIMNDEIHYKEVLDLNIPIHYLIRKTKNDISVFKLLYQLCKKYKPDIIHCWDSMTAIYSMPVCKMLNIKLVNGLITNSPEQQNIINKHWLRAKITFPLSDIIIGNSKAGLVAYKAPQSKSFCIHNGFNFERNNNLISDELIRRQFNINTKYVIGMVASYSKNKDYKTYFDAAKILLEKRKDITFLAIGGDTDSTSAKSHISNEYCEFFRLLGKKSDIESYINALDISVLSTFTEGISNSILEYMALGKPVIATSGGGTNEIIIDNETGFLISRSNPGELAEKIEILLQNKELRFKMGAAGKERIKTFFSIDNMVNNYFALYNKILTRLSIKKINAFEKLFREVLAFILIQIHYVVKSKHEGILSIYFHNPSKGLFDKILNWLISKGYKFVSIKELENIIYQKINTEKLVFICFDDGWKGNLDLLESIKKYKVPTVIFVPADIVKEGNYWWEYIYIKGQQKFSGFKKLADFKRLPEVTFREKIAILKYNYRLKRSCVTLDELKKISDNEFITIGSHTVTHPILINCSYETQIQELMESKQILSQWLNKDVEYLAYPNGDYNDDTLEIAKKCGYKLGFTTNPGEIDVKKVNPYIIPRNALYDIGGYYENISKILGIWQKVFSINGIGS
jgi:glycosyltransferase involved in cell wall biosynthesis/peptidoglycan/xylan/chitin deacetylase (PgdA/CDA1 family)